MTSPSRKTTLTRRYARQVAGIAALLLACAALIEGTFGYRQAREQMHKERKEGRKGVVGSENT